MVKYYGHLKILAQWDSDVHIRIALIYNTFFGIARASRPNKQREAKQSIYTAFL